ncbi:hypothetical protein BGZ51_000333, partial [Haplosporangium sp. Z 767]
ESPSLPRFHVGNTGHTIPAPIKDEKRMRIKDSMRIDFISHQMAGNGSCQGFDVRDQLGHSQGHILGMDDLRIKLRRRRMRPQVSLRWSKSVSWSGTRQVTTQLVIHHPSIHQSFHSSIHPAIRRYMICSDLIGQNLTGNQNQDKDKD